jgi:hypothetical protein
MMRVLGVLILFALQDLPSGALAQEGDRVAPLLRELEAPDARKVYQAVGQLVALGEPALPSIEARTRDSKGRTRDYLQLAADEIRALRLLRGFEPARRVSMKSTDRNVVELLGDLRAKTGVALTLENLMGEEKMPEVPVDIRDATMLEAFDAICRAGNVTLAMENGQFSLFQGDYQDLPRFFYDRYFFRLHEFVLLKTADFRKPAVHSFKLQMELLWDPAAAPCRFSAPVVLEAVDDKGKNLIPPPPPAGQKPKEKPDEAAADSEPEAMSSLVLLPPSQGSEKIAVLRGVTTISLPRTLVTLSFGEESSRKTDPAPKKPAAPAPTLPASEEEKNRKPDPPPPPPPQAQPDKPAAPQAEPGVSPLEGLSRKSGDFTVRISRIESPLYRFVCEISSPAMKPEDLSRLPFLANVVLKGGDATRAYISASSKGDVAEVTVSFQPLHIREILVQPNDDRPAPPPVIEKVELSIVTAVQERRIPFEFRDVKIK